MTELLYPFPTAPAHGETVEIAPGVLWLRLPLPFRLNHVNIYLLEEDDGWTIIDTGVDDARTRAIWEQVFQRIFGSKPVRRLIVTHFHPDHVGAAAFLSGRSGAPLVMGETEYLTARVQTLAGGDIETAAEQGFYRRHGLGFEQLAFMGQRLSRYRTSVPTLPPSYLPLRAGDKLRIGGRCFDVLCFGGHSPAQMLLHSRDGDLLFAADHVLPQISPNVSVAEDKPGDDPLGLYLASFDAIRAIVPDTVLVFPGHRLPFLRLHARLRDLARHHAERCALIVEACRARALSVGELVPVLFPMELDAHQLWFAFSEALAHVNYLARRDRLVGYGEDGVTRWREADGGSRIADHAERQTAGGLT